MAISTLTQEEIDEHVAQRGRLEPIARSLGLVYDEDNMRLMYALDTISVEQQRRASNGRKPTTAAQPSAPGSQTFAKRASHPSTTVPAADVGTKVVNLMRAKRGLPPIESST